MYILEENKYNKGVCYKELIKDSNQIVTYWDTEYTGKVEADWIDNSTFLHDKPIVHLYGMMCKGIVSNIRAEAQFSNGCNIRLENSLSTVLSYPELKIQWRPYGKFI